MAKKKKRRPLPPFDKYDHYVSSVQSPEIDARFFKQVYTDARGRTPKNFTLREDFCGTFITACEWVKMSPDHRAFGLDLDDEPLAYGREHFLPRLRPDQQERLRIMKKDVLSRGVPAADVIAALNFSFFLFKEREDLKAYFANCYKSLNKNGVMIIDCFGGSKCQEGNEEETEFTDKKFSYFWDQEFYDPVTNHAVFYIHFKRRGEKKREKVFTYDWRMWTVPELMDILLEVGFREVNVYWEGTNAKGEGNGRFRRVTKVREECESWVAYMGACK